MALETRAKWTDLISGVGLEIADVFDQGMEQYQPGISSLLSVTSGEGAQKNFTGKTGISGLKRFDEGDNMPQGQRYKTYTTTISYNDYGEFLEVSANSIVDHNYQQELSAMKDLGIDVNFSQDRSGVQLFNGGFSTDEDVNGFKMNWYGDGVPHFSTVHPTVVPGQSTQSNASSTGVPLGHDSFETGQIAMIEQQTDDGKPMNMAGKITLAVAPSQRRTAREITASDLNPELQADLTDQNAINVFKGAADVVETHFLASVNGGSDDAWYLTVPQRNKMFHEVRQGAELNQDVDIKSKNVTYTVDARWANYTLDWRRSWASKGDGEAYAA